MFHPLFLHNLIVCFRIRSGWSVWSATGGPASFAIPPVVVFYNREQQWLRAVKAQRHISSKSHEEGSQVPGFGVRE